MLKRLCPICGKETKKFYDNFCKSCFIEKNSEKLKIDVDIKIYNCKVCNKFYLENEKEASNSFELALNKFLNKVKSKVFSAEIFLDNSNYFLKVAFLIDNIKVSKTFKLNVETKSIKCLNCLRVESGKAKAILQVRSNDWEEILDFCQKFSENFYLSEIYKNGFDLIVDNESNLLKISNVLIGKFRLKRKLTKKILGIKKGKRIFQTTILLSSNF